MKYKTTPIAAATPIGPPEQTGHEAGSSGDLRSGE